MKKTIFNVYVVMDSQATCDRMKKLCIDNGLDYWNSSYAFNFNHNGNVFAFDDSDFFDKSFFVFANKSDCKEYFQVTELDFINLLKEHKMAVHNIKLESVNFEVIGVYDKADPTTGTSHGFSIMDVKVNDVSIYFALNGWCLEQLKLAVLEGNY